MHRSKLQKFIKINPCADMFIESTHPTDPTKDVCVSANGYLVAMFSRRRDAWRALRNEGFFEEGCMWRKLQKAEQPVVFDAKAEKVL